MARPEGFGSMKTFLFVFVKLFDLSVGDVNFALDAIVEQIFGNKINFDSFFKFIFRDATLF